jgi:hypothetical protein
MGFDVKEDEEVYPAPPPPSGFTSNCRGGGTGMRGEPHFKLILPLGVTVQTQSICRQRVSSLHFQMER